MDFPASLMTNLYRNKNVDRIYWSQWMLQHRPRPEPVKVLPSVLFDLTILRLLNELRSHDLYACFDHEQHVVWLFSLSEKVWGDVENLASCSELSILTEGSLCTDDLSSLQQDTQGSKAVGVSSHPHNATQLLNLAFGKALEAIEFSACRLLVQNLGWVSFSPLSRLALWPGRRIAGKDLSIIRSFKCNWHTDGTIDLLALSSNIPNLTTLKERLHERRGPVYGEKVVLCPLGKFAQYSCLSDEEKDQDAKDVIRKELAGADISIPRGSMWIEVFIEASPDHVAPDVKGSPEPIIQIWPAQITLCQAARENTRTDFMHPRPKHSIDFNPDHLARVQDWFLGQTGRSNAVRSTQKNLDTQALQPLKEVSHGDLDTYEEIFTPISPTIIVPDVSGIYPTPSDGLPSQVPELDQQGTPLGLVDHNTTAPRRDSRSVPGSGIRQNSFSGTDVDMDIFAANDLTEADFNFFDEPDMESPKAFAIAMDEFNSTLAFPAQPFEAVAITSALSFHAEVHESTVGLSHNGNSSVSEQNLEERQPSSQPLTADYREDRSKAIQYSSSPEKKTDEETQPKLFLRTNQQDDNVRRNIPSRGSFNPLLLKDVGFEGKYGVRGRFGYYADDFLSSTKNPKPAKRIMRSTMARARDGVDETESLSGESDRTSDDEVENVSSSATKWGSLKVVDQFSPHQGDSSSKAEVFDAPSRLPSRRPSFGNGSTPVKEGILSECAPFKDFSDSPTTSYRPLVADDRSITQVSQLIADQAACQTSQSTTNFAANDAGMPLENTPTNGSLPTAFPVTQRCTLEDLADKFRQPKLEKGTMPSSLRPAITRLEAPYINVRRAGSSIDLNHSSVTFWEELGLSPASGPKEVRAIFVYPDVDYLYDPVSEFLSEIESAYQTCNLGDHALTNGTTYHPAGHFRVKSEVGELCYSLKDLNTAMRALGKHLASLKQQNVNTVVYMLETSSTTEALPYLCDSFLRLFETYRLSLSTGQVGGNRNDLVLQVVPLGFVFDFDRLVLPSVSDYKKLAFEVYDRCTPSRANGGEMPPPYRSASAIRLCRPLPKYLDFKLNPDHSGILSTSESCLHLAYKWLVGQKWLVASWTDDFGTIHWNAAYWLGDEHSDRIFPLVANEMWETSLDILGHHRTVLQVFIVKDGPLEAYERPAWQSIKDRSGTSTHLTLVSIKQDPALEISSLRNSNAAMQPSEIPQTPLPDLQSTDLFSESPGQVASSAAILGSTGLVDNDTSAKLIDITDETWSVILTVDIAQTLRQSKTRGTSNVQPPSMISGLIAKRSGPSNADGVVFLQLDLIPGAGAGDPKVQLRSVLEKYRNLSLLARLRNVTNPLKGIVPIHVAAVRNAYHALVKSVLLEGE